MCAYDQQTTPRKLARVEAGPDSIIVEIRTNSLFFERLLPRTGELAQNSKHTNRKRGEYTVAAVLAIVLRVFGVREMCASCARVLCYHSQGEN